MKAASTGVNISSIFSSLVLKKEKKTFFDSDVHVYLND